MHAPLQLTAVEKFYRSAEQSVHALRGIDLTIETGSFVAIMGASGSGKSTLLHAAAGLTDVDAGTVQINGSNLADMSDDELSAFRLEQVGMVFQAFNLVPTLNALDNIALPLVLAGKPRAEAQQQAQALLTAVDLAARAKHFPDQLSGGEQQRIAFARALIAKPALILADEPTGNLDSAATAVVGSLLHTIQAEYNTTIVLITHEPQVALWAQRVVIISDGQLCDDFSPDADAGAAGIAQRYTAHTSTAVGASA